MKMRKININLNMFIAAVVPIMFVLTTLCITTNSRAEDNCAERISELETQLQFAESAGNTAKVIGLKKSLANIRQHCTEKSMTEKSEKKAQKLNKKIEETKEDIAEHQEDMREAASEGRMDKVHKKQRKIKEKQLKLKHLQKEMSETK